MRNDRRMALAIVMLVMLSISGAAQSRTDAQTDPQKARPRTTTSGEDKDKKKAVVGDRLEPDDTSRPPADVSEDAQANRKEQLSEQTAVERYYNNFFTTYRLGPEDV